MYSAADLSQEIEIVIQDYERKGPRSLHPEWITQAVMERHADIDGEDADFFRCVGRAQVRDQVRQRLNRFKVKAELQPDQQLVLEGFERLQRRYLISEDGEQVAVRIQDMTSAQRRAKVAELRMMGAGCYQHADELDRYDAQMAAA